MNRLLILMLSGLLAPAVFADLRIEIDLSDRIAITYLDGEKHESFDVAVGKAKYPTPTGEFAIRKVIWNPSWTPPPSKWARGKSPKGPADPDNPMKLVKMFFKEPDYYIHGTGDEESLGRAESHGCIRMSKEEVGRLAKLVMEHGGKPMPEPWYRRVFRRKTTKVIHLSEPVPIEIRE